VKAEFVEYLRGLGMSDTLLEEAERKYAQCAVVIAPEFDDIFASEYVDGDG
jgi:hypothetical protein